MSEDIDDLKRKRLCFNCVSEKFLSTEIALNGTRRKCSYCNKASKSYELSKLANRMDEVFVEHFDRTSDQPTPWEYTLLSDKEGDYDWERRGEPIIDAITNAMEIPDSAAEDIQKILADEYDDLDSAAMGEETEYSSETHYEEKGPDDSFWQKEWENFERSLKTEARFFSSSAMSHLSAVFADIDTMKTRHGKAIVIDAGPGCELSSLYRARVFQSDNDLRKALETPDKSLGSPPSHLANAGRMNARGISVFYSATDPKVALAEVRPPVGSQVTVASFEIIRPIRLLDLPAITAIHATGSLFDRSFSKRLGRAMFLRSLSSRIAKPVMPDDEVFEYLPTQAVADFLAAESGANIDGIIFKSAQAEHLGLNVVLFHKASRVAEREVPKNTKIEASLGQMYEDGWDTQYTVIEITSPAPAEQQVDALTPPDIDDLLFTESATHKCPDSRPTTLNVDPKSLKIHFIRSVEFNTDEHQVQWHRWKRTTTDF